MNEREMIAAAAAKREEITILSRTDWCPAKWKASLQ